MQDYKLTDNLMETTIQLIKCDHCAKVFSGDKIKHYDMDISEADYCNDCAEMLDAQFDVEDQTPY